MVVRLTPIAAAVVIAAGCATSVRSVPPSKPSGAWTPVDRAPQASLPAGGRRLALVVVDLVAGGLAADGLRAEVASALRGPAELRHDRVLDEETIEPSLRSSPSCIGRECARMIGEGSGATHVLRTSIDRSRSPCQVEMELIEVRGGAAASAPSLGWDCREETIRDVVRLAFEAVTTAPSARAYETRTSAWGSGGAKIGWTDTEVRRRSDPSAFSFNWGLVVGAVGVLDAGGGGGGAAVLGLNARMLVARFPDTTGGSLFGADLALVGVGLGGVVKERRSEVGPLGGGIGMGQLAIQWAYLGSASADTLEQSGFGIRLGASAGAQVIVERDVTIARPLIGPILELLFPKYNAGTTKLTQTSLAFQVIPMPPAMIATVSLTFLW